MLRVRRLSCCAELLPSDFSRHAAVLVTGYYLHNPHWKRKLANRRFAKLLHETGRESTVEGIDNRASSAHYDLLIENIFQLEVAMYELIKRIWSDDQGQDIAEYAVMLAVILVLVVGTIRLVGSNANNAFSSVASSLN